MATKPIWYFYSYPMFHNWGPVPAERMQQLIDNKLLPTSVRIRFTDSVHPLGDTLCFEASVGYILARFGKILPSRLDQMGLRGTFISTAKDEETMQLKATADSQDERETESPESVAVKREFPPVQGITEQTQTKLTYFVRNKKGKFGGHHSATYVHNGFTTGQYSISTKFRITDNRRLRGDLFTVEGTLFQFFEKFGTFVPMTVEDISIRGYVNLSDRTREEVDLFERDPGTVVQGKKRIDIILTGNKDTYAGNSPKGSPPTLETRLDHAAPVAQWTPMQRPKIVRKKQAPAYSYRRNSGDAHRQTKQTRMTDKSNTLRAPGRHGWNKY